MSTSMSMSSKSKSELELELESESESTKTKEMKKKNSLTWTHNKEILAKNKERQPIPFFARIGVEVKNFDVWLVRKSRIWSIVRERNG